MCLTVTFIHTAHILLSWQVDEIIRANGIPVNSKCVYHKFARVEKALLKHSQNKWKNIGRLGQKTFIRTVRKRCKELFVAAIGCLRTGPQLTQYVRKTLLSHAAQVLGAD